MESDIVARLRVWSTWLDERVPDTEVGNDLREAADEIERLRARVAELERFASELDASGRKHTEPAALRGTPSDGEASASEGYLHTGASVQTEKAN